MVWGAAWALGIFKAPLLMIMVQLKLRTTAKTLALSFVYIILQSSVSLFWNLFQGLTQILFSECGSV